MSKIIVDISGIAALSEFMREEMRRKLTMATDKSMREHAVHGCGLNGPKAPKLRLVWSNPDAKLTPVD